MASLLIFYKETNDHPDRAQDWKKFKRGDVIAVREDGFNWGRAVHEPSPDVVGLFRVIEVPGVPVSELQFLADSEEVPRTDDDRELPHRIRPNKLDLAALGIGKEIVKTVETKAAILSARSLKPAVTSDDVIGDDAVIG